MVTKAAAGARRKPPGTKSAARAGGASAGSRGRQAHRNVRPDPKGKKKGDNGQSKNPDGLFEKLTGRKRLSGANLKGPLSRFPFLLEIKPKESYLFRSNDYQADGKWFAILSYFHKDGAYDDFGPFWGINRIPSGTNTQASVTCVETVERMSEGWVKDHQSRAEDIADKNSDEQAAGRSRTNQLSANKQEHDLAVIAGEFQTGATYLRCTYRIQIRADSEKELEDTIRAIERMYIDRFSTLYAESYDGEQKNELATLLRPIDYKKGKPFYFTSTEFAGSYSLVTRGIEDARGTYIGQMAADVNTAGILFDLDGYRHHIICCSEQIDSTWYRANVPDLWGSKISQACLMNDHKVAHIILNGARLNELGPAFAQITRKLDMNQGDVNMFELFGDIKDELAAFPMQMQKLVLMTEQAYPCSDSERSIIRGNLEEILTQFYIDQRMWYENAGANREKLRVVGVPHRSVPKLEMFATYLDTAYKAMVNQTNYDPDTLKALGILRLTFKNLLANNGDLFNTTTTDEIDEVGRSRRVLYDFSKLRGRGIGVMMAQLLNIIAFCTGNLSEGDTLFIHGAELIDDTIKDYLSSLFDQLYAKGGRVCFLYNNNEKMMSDTAFSAMDKAEYTILGTLTDNEAAKYQDVLGQTIPGNLAQQVTAKSDTLTFLHRDLSNIIFNRDLILFPGDAKHRIPRVRKVRRGLQDAGTDGSVVSKRAKAKLKVRAAREGGAG